MADSPARIPCWRHRCFMEPRRERRSPVGYTSRSVNCSELCYIRAADTRSRLPGGRHKCSRPALPSSASYRSRGFVEALQEMFLASRPKFVGMAYSILRNKEDAEDAVQDAFLSAYR